MIYHCISIVFAKRRGPELVAIVADLRMAMAWCRRAPAGEYRRCVRWGEAP